MNQSNNKAKWTAGLAGLIKTLLRLSVLLCTWLATAAWAVDSSDGLKVITGTQVTYSIASALLENTPIEAVNLPEDGRRFSSLKSYIERRKETFEPLFTSADAVIAMTNVLPSDPIYRFAREANIHLVYIDAAQPWSFNASGVSLVEQPLTDVAWGVHGEASDQVLSSYFWLSLTNAVRMSDIVGADLARVFPEFSETILENRRALKDELLTLYREFQTRLFEVDDISVFSLASEFVYLTNDMGLFVDGYFIKQDIDWTESDLADLSAHLASRDLQVVLHKWQPSEVIQEAVEAAGAKIVVLDTADPGISVDGKLSTTGYQQIMRNNLEAILAALQD